MMTTPKKAHTDVDGPKVADDEVDAPREAPELVQKQHVEMEGDPQ